MRSVKPTHRDEQLVMVLAEARCLSAAQVGRLFFPGRHEGTVRNRLSQLAKGDAYLRRLFWYDRKGQHLAYSLATEGYSFAEVLLERELVAAREDITADHLAHHLLMTELYVGLLAAPMEAALAKLTVTARAKQHHQNYARAAHPSFRWHVVGDLDLPWKQVDGAKLEARVIRPDAVLELVDARRRVFIESETGTQSITTSKADKVGATINKIERYEAYCSLPSGPGTGRTWYTERYPDGFRPEVLILVPTELRRRSVQRVVDDWRKRHVNAVCRFRVSTVAGELALLVPVAWPGVTAVAPSKPVPSAPNPPAAPAVAPAPPPAGVAQLTPDEVRLVYKFFSATQGYFKARREKARALGKPLPEYPAGTPEVHALVSRLVQRIP